MLATQKIERNQKPETPAPVKYPEVDRRTGLSIREFNREYRDRGRPVVITDAAEDWTARRTWTLPYFRDKYGKFMVEAHRYQDGYQSDRRERMTLGEYIDKILVHDWDSFPCYIRDNWNLPLEHPELLDDYTQPDYFYDWFAHLPKFMRLVYPRIFIGGRGAVTPFHLDIWGTHAWLTQLVGRKRWIFVPPDQLPLLHDYQVQPDKPDFERFPEFRTATPVECTIGPGDTVFAPSNWPHYVVSLDPTLSITYNYMGPGCLWSSLKGSVRDNVVPGIKRKFIG